MAEKKFVGKFELDGSKGEESIKSIKSQLKDAKNELVGVIDKFGELSPEAAKAAQKVAQLEDKIGDAKKLSDAFNPDAKFKGLSGAIQGAVGAFTALQGAQALFGSESKEVAATLAKVQGALAFSQGINSVLDAKDSIKAFGAQLMSLNIVQKIVTAAQWLWNAALSANPIGAIVIAVAALTAGIAALVGWLRDSAAEAKAQASAVEANTKAIEKQTKTLENNNSAFQKSNEHKINMAKASGMSAKAVRELELKLADEKIAFERSAKTIAFQTEQKERNYLATLRAADADEELIKKQIENVNKATEETKKQVKNTEAALNEKLAIQRRHEVEITQEQTNAAKTRADQKKKSDDEAKKAQEEADKLLQQVRIDLKSEEQKKLEQIDVEYNERKKTLEAAGIKDFTDIEAARQNAIAQVKLEYRNKILQIEQQTNDLVLQNQLNSITDSYTRQQQEIENNYQKQVDEALKLLDDKNIKEEDRQRLYNERRAAIDEQYNLQIASAKKENDLKTYNEDLKNLEDKINSDNLMFDAKREALDKENALVEDARRNGLISEEDYTKKVKEQSDKRKSIDNAEKENKRAQLAATAGLLSGFADLVGKQTKAGKAAAKTALVIQQAQAVGSIITNTQEAVAKDVSNFPLTSGMPWAAIHIAQGVLGVANSIKAVKKGIADINGATESSGGGGSAADVGSAPAAPIPPTPQTTILPQEQINQMATANATTRAYVVESDVTNNQERMIRLNRAARIN